MGEFACGRIDRKAFQNMILILGLPAHQSNYFLCWIEEEIINSEEADFKFFCFVAAIPYG